RLHSPPLPPPQEACKVHAATRGARLRTYAIPGEPGSGEICVNGAAAHLIKPHDLVIIASWTEVEGEEARTWEAKRVFVDSSNRIREQSELESSAEGGGGGAAARG